MSDASTPPPALTQAARAVRLNAYAPYSNFQVGAALLAEDGSTHIGCNVENIAYPEGTCAEAGALAAMIAAGSKRFTQIVVVADSPSPVPPCGGCRQKLAEFAAPGALVHMLSLTGSDVYTLTVSDLLPGAFGAAHMGNDAK